jgi:alkylation response protein AidB-like acyl-CoA dehydrogenase
VCRKRHKNPAAPIRPFVQERAAENSIDLSAARAIFGRALRMIDEYEEGHPTDRGSMGEIAPVFAEVQRAKAFVNAAAVRILDRALAMSGGAGYLSANPLSRLYRDARAGAFMHPLGVHVGTEYLGAHTLGLRPTQF